MSIWEQLTGYLSFSFVRYALIAGVLIALCSSLLGVTPRYCGSAITCCW